MHKLLTFIPVFLIISFVVFSFNEVQAGDYNKSVDLILNSAEKFFIALRDGEYETAWDLLSEKSHKTIINDIYTSSMKMGGKIKKKDIIKDFQSRGVMFNNYWNAFLTTFDTYMILEHSVWEMGSIKKNKAEIILTHKKTNRLTRLKMYKEEGVWKVGLVETFWIKRNMEFLQFIFQLFT